jgi:hypothetical protein
MRIIKVKAIKNVFLKILYLLILRSYKQYYKKYIAAATIIFLVEIKKNVP